MAYVCAMIAILTGDIVRYASADPEKWQMVLQKFLNKQGQTPKTWEIFRGDSFQFKCKPEEAFMKFLLLKSIMRQIPGLDVRVGIGIGTIEYTADRITQSNGTAFVRSGRTFDGLKEKQYLAVSTGSESIDKPLDLMIRFASLVMDNWSSATAETVYIILSNPGWNQQQVAEKLKINQSAVSQNRKRAQLDLILELNDYYKTNIKSLDQ